MSPLVFAKPLACDSFRFLVWWWCATGVPAESVSFSSLGIHGGRATHHTTPTGCSVQGERGWCLC